MKNLSKNSIRSGILLAFFALIGTGLLSFTHEMTRDKIIAVEREALQKSLHKIINPDMHDNELYTDTITVTDRALLGSKEPVTVYRARMQGKNVAVVFSSIAPDGYNGTIKLLVGILKNGTLSGVRIVTHRETPGLGDAIEAERSDWILGFNEKSLTKPDISKWKVKKDGGAFDQFTGATITPRAIVKAVKNTLLYYQTHQQEVFTATTVQTGNPHE
ncbi:MAG: electron transport complex subunit RsxG [Gammaproteobacteria bacterium]|nr:electron transport complex subunit RsxG [Gammaproteobacteria bacterium]